MHVKYLNGPLRGHQAPEPYDDCQIFSVQGGDCVMYQLVEAAGAAGMGYMLTDCTHKATRRAWCMRQIQDGRIPRGLGKRWRRVLG